MSTDKIPKGQYHIDKHHYSNWCRICGCYFCWHQEGLLPECKRHIADHPFKPMCHDRDFYDQFKNKVIYHIRDFMIRWFT